MEISKSLRSLRWKQWIYKTEKITILIVFMGTNWNIFSVFQQIIKTTQLLIWKSFIFKKSLFKKFISKKSLFKNQVINCLITKSSPYNSKKTFKNAKKTTEIKGFAKVFLLKKPLFLVLINAVNFLISLRWIFTAKIFFTAMNSLLVSQCILKQRPEPVLAILGLEKQPKLINFWSRITY